mmetsp:Transcript_4197/g.12030  ORF Transcript_4197/g.12030 Transcript_4197/m.12030 type:complete len:98 (+) Transcript_4197:268-561(+)
MYSMLTHFGLIYGFTNLRIVRKSHLTKAYFFVCTHQLQRIAEKNALSGSLPSEVGLLTALTDLDLDLDFALDSDLDFVSLLDNLLASVSAESERAVE